jgi:hypothetical protein
VPVKKVVLGAIEQSHTRPVDQPEAPFGIKNENGKTNFIHGSWQKSHRLRGPLAA